MKATLLMITLALSVWGCGTEDEGSGAPAAGGAVAGAGGAGGAGAAMAGGAGGEVMETPERLPPGECIGPEQGESPPTAETIADISEETCTHCPGAEMPKWQLYDFQPQSCGYGATHGLDSFLGRVTLVALFNAGCPYCQAQAEKMEQMRIELEAEGHEVWFVAVNLMGRESLQAELTNRAAFPMFQDTEGTNAWGMHQGGLSDYYVYDESGVLVTWLPNGGEVNTTLANEEGYANLKNAVLEALGE
ncbi:MAG: redoxin domain-containing protein [Bradymonadia bacterium]